MTALQIQRTETAVLKLRLVAIIVERRAKALRWRKMPEGVARRETLKAAISLGVIERRIKRALNLRENPPSRTDYWRKQKAAKRRAAALEGGATITLRLTRDEQAFFRLGMETQNGDAASFLKRALLAGIAFVANSGNVRAGKKRLKPNYDHQLVKTPRH